jgi:hypothetical protein
LTSTRSRRSSPGGERDAAVPAGALR